MLYKTPLGPLSLCEENDFLISASFSETQAETSPTPVLLQAVRELDEYFVGKRERFDVPLNPVGTSFQRKVWAELQRIPFGSTVSYGELARRIGQPNASRAVGMANHRNPLAIFIPCHRVIGSDGSLTGYAGGVEVKRFLLELEQKVLREKKDVLREKGVDETGN